MVLTSDEISVTISYSQLQMLVTLMNKTLSHAILLNAVTA